MGSRMAVIQELTSNAFGGDIALSAQYVRL